MALSTTGIEAFQSSSAERNLIAAYWMLGNQIKVYDDVTTEVVEYHGMPEAEAKAKAIALRSNNMSDYYIQGNGLGAGWIRCPNAKGTRVMASCKRNGNSRMFTVTKVTEMHTCSNSAGWSEVTS